MQKGKNEVVPTALKQHYRVTKTLGQGGFGTVYQAEDTALGGRLVAIKEMDPSGLRQQEKDQAIASFHSEALILAQLSHPGLPRIYEHFEEGGLWYVVMEYIEGQTLEQYRVQAPRGCLPLEEVLQIGLQLCDVLEYLHKQRPPVIFRDLKPANIMRTPGGQLFLIDFGIARHFKPGQAKDTTIVGSPGYAAPEQYGRAQSTVRSDIYGLGASLYCLLTGDDPADHPFRFTPIRDRDQRGPGKLLLRMVQMDDTLRPASIALVKSELLQLASLAAGNAGGASPISRVQARPVPHSPAPPGTLLYTYRGHTGSISMVAWSPDGRLLASAGRDSTVQVWEPLTGKKHLTYRGHKVVEFGIHAVAWSPDGRCIASAGEDQTVQVWEARTGRTRCTFPGHRESVKCLSWSPDGTCIASGGYDGNVHVWEAFSGTVLLTYEGHKNRSPLPQCIDTVAWSPDGTRLASGGQDMTVQVWEPVRGTCLTTYRGHTGWVKRVAWSPDGKRIASTSYDYTLQVWEALTGQRAVSHFFTDNRTQAVHASLVWSPGGEYLAATDGWWTVHVWDRAVARVLLTYKGHTFWIESLAWSPDGQYVASSSEDQTVQVWQAPK